MPPLSEARMKPKPKIRKDGSEWVIERPRCGFGKPETLRFPTGAEAIARFRAIPKSQGGSFDRAAIPEPSRYQGRRGWRSIIR
jgi:hypothetical protein